MYEHVGAGTGTVARGEARYEMSTHGLFCHTVRSDCHRGSPASLMQGTLEHSNAEKGVHRFAAGASTYEESSFH